MKIKKFNSVSQLKEEIFLFNMQAAKSLFLLDFTTLLNILGHQRRFLHRA